ncbi:MAG: hypothetical protein HY614_01150, partial [Candidatus Rokubacteria bacterium]|nr:hypothetical protein [Candidatus Rokubacteria bacterium]
MSHARRLGVTLLVSGIALLAVAALALFLGSANLSSGDVLRVLAGRAPEESTASVVILK